MKNLFFSINRYIVIPALVFLFAINGGSFIVSFTENYEQVDCCSVDAD